MHSTPVIPHGDAPHGPLPAHAVVVGTVDVVGEEVEDLVGLELFGLGEAGDEAWVDVERAEARYGVRTHGGVVRVDGGAVRADGPEVEDCVVLEAGGVDGVEGGGEGSAEGKSSSFPFFLFFGLFGSRMRGWGRLLTSSHRLVHHYNPYVETHAVLPPTSGCSSIRNME